MKKVLSLTLALLLLLTTFPVYVSATEADPIFSGPYSELKQAIYQQLKAQDQLEHLELHFAALIPQDDSSSVSSNSRSTQSWTASNGGELSYTYDWRYQNEDGYVTSLVSYMAPNDTNAFYAAKYATVGDLISELTGVAVGSLIQSIPALAFLSSYGKYVTLLSILDLITDVITKAQINNAGNYSKLSVVYDSLSDSTSKVIVAWTDHPTVTLYRENAYDVSFIAKN